jgi:transposase, IS30 family
MYHQLSPEERYTIARCRAHRWSTRAIAFVLGRSASTISRELRRNAKDYDGNYRAELAHSYAVARRRRCRRGSQFDEQQLQLVDQLIQEEWSPEQIAGRLGKEAVLKISRETIYRRIRRDRKRGGVLWKSLRVMPKFGRKRYGRRDSRGVLPGKRHISERPAAVEQRRELGHWEADTVIGADKRHCILTLTERATRFVVIKKLLARTMDEVTRALSQVLHLHRGIKTITFDNGTEFHDYAKVEQRFPVKCYFATPYHSWERGTNENMNGLIRQYLPKGSCMRHVTQELCNYIAFKLNSRPRKTLGFKTPSEIYYPSV